MVFPEAVALLLLVQSGAPRWRDAAPPATERLLVLRAVEATTLALPSSAARSPILEGESASFFRLRGDVPASLGILGGERDPILARRAGAGWIRRGDPLAAEAGPTTGLEEIVPRRLGLAADEGGLPAKAALETSPDLRVVDRLELTLERFLGGGGGAGAETIVGRSDPFGREDASPFGVVFGARFEWSAGLEIGGSLEWRRTDLPEPGEEALDRRLTLGFAVRF